LSFADEEEDEEEEEEEEEEEGRDVKKAATSAWVPPAGSDTRPCSWPCFCRFASFLSCCFLRTLSALSFFSDSDRSALLFL
jgi:hypothetical protein